jgi:hypothetical protein
MENLNKEQLLEIKKILTVENDEKRLMDLKSYLSNFQEQLTRDFASIAYNIWLEHGGNTNNKNN